jgi:sugar phosphate isomerase/epimerase
MAIADAVNQSRRGFLKASLAAAAAGCLLRASGTVFADIAGMTFGVQLFMLRKQAQTNLPGVFRAIHDAGFPQVELYPIAYGHTAAEIRSMMADAGVAAVAGHFDYIGLEDKLGFAQQLGLKYFVCPMLPKEQWTSLQGFGNAADLFNRVGKHAQSSGMEMVFHNHCYEFRPMEGSNGFAYLMQHTDPALVKLELDIYWLMQGGQDPMAVLKRHADRVRLIHMKDRLAGSPTGYTMDPPQYFTELGKGTIDWPAVLKQARSQGIRYAFDDQDDTNLPIPESLKISRAYLRHVQG